MDQIRYLKFINESKKSNLFNDYHNIAIHYFNVARVSDLKGLHLHCRFNHYAKSIKAKFSSLCNRKYLELIIKQEKVSDELSYFKQNISDFLKSKDLLFSFTGEIQKRPDLHNRISKIIKHYYQSNKLSPPLEIISFLNIDREFSGYIQNAGISDPSSKSLFNSAIKEMYDNIVLSIENSKFNYALDLSDSLATFIQENHNFVNISKGLKYLIYAGKKFTYKGKTDSAKKIFTKAINLSMQYQNADLIEESLFSLLWADIFTDNYRGALQTIKSTSFYNDAEKLPNKLNFWVATIYEENKNDKLSSFYFNKLIESAPLSYYSILVLKKYSDKFLSNTDDYLKSFQDRPISSVAFPRFSDSTKNAMKRILIWISLDKEALANYEIENLLKLSKNQLLHENAGHSSYNDNDVKKVMLTLITKGLANQKRYLDAFKISYRFVQESGIKINQTLLRSIFPSDFFGQIKEQSKIVDPIVILSLIRQESAFDPFAKSVAGARGLMQLMPTTARHVMNGPLRKTASLHNPDLNIKLGIRYLEKLVGQFDGNLIFSLAAYNAGPHRVKQWKSEIFQSKNPIVLIESIPYQETSKYVKLIYRNIFFYQLIHESPELKKEFESSFSI